MEIVTNGREEVEKLKRDWLLDACWDIEETDGFQEYYNELKAFRLEKEKEWEETRLKKIEAQKEHARSLGVEGLYDIIIELQEKCDRYERAIYLMADDRKYDAYRTLKGHEVD